MLLKPCLLVGLAASFAAACGGPRDQPAPAPFADPTTAATIVAPLSPAPTRPDPTALVSERPASENKIPMAIRGDWKKVERETTAATPDCSNTYANAGRVVHIDADRIGFFETSALLVSIDQISSDYLRATFAERVGSHVSRSIRTLDVDDDGMRLAMRSTDQRGTRVVERYQRCPTLQQ